MIKLINNEFVKVGYAKILLSYLVFTIVTLFLYILEDYNLEFEFIYKYVMFIGVYASFLFGGSISNEASKGSFRFYLTKPYKRYKIYLSKLFSIIFYIIFVSFYIIFLYILFTGVIDIKVIGNFAVYCIPLILHSVLILLFSTIFKSTSLSVGIYIFLVMFGLSISQLLFGYGLDFVSYSFLPYLDFCIFYNDFYLEINELFNVSLNLSSGIIICLVYFCFLIVIGIFLFTKKDINN